MKKKSSILCNKSQWPVAVPIVFSFSLPKHDKKNTFLFPKSGLTHYLELDNDRLTTVVVPLFHYV